MHLDHVTFAAGPDGLDATTAKLSDALGAAFLDGGVHPRFGTRNAILPLANRQYFEVVEALEHPASDKMPFGQAVKARTALGGGWLHWCIAVNDIAPVEHRIGRHAVPGNRHRPDGFNLEWVQIGLKDVTSDPQLPYVTQWLVDPSEHPSQKADTGVELVAIEISGDPKHLADWLGEAAIETLESIEVRWNSPNGFPGITAVEFKTPSGLVRL
jgi:hypothetical protein